jgi:hypothetical protein
LTRIKQHIATVLAGILIFPVIFQSVHVIWHHSHDHPVTVEHACCSDTRAGSCENVTEILSNTGHCPVCEYQFTVNMPHNVTVHEAIIPSRAGTYRDLTTFTAQLQPVSLKSPRAPPSLM